MMDYAEIGLERLTSYFDNAPKFRALVAGILSYFTDLEDQAELIRLNRWIDTGEGVQLDLLGTIVGEARQGRLDPAYRNALRFRIFINTSRGTIPDLLTALAYVSGGNDQQYIEMKPMQALLFTNGLFVDSSIQALMQNMAPVAVSDIPIAVSFSDTPLRMGGYNALNFLNTSSGYLQTSLGRLRISAVTGGARGSSYLGGLAPDTLGDETGYIVLDDGSMLAVHSTDTATILGNDVLTGVYQI